MAVFDESKVINALHTDKAEIGKKYYAEHTIIALKKIIGMGNYHRLVRNEAESDYPFTLENSEEEFSLIYPYEEPKKKLVPFTWEDRERLRGKWVVKKSDLWYVDYLITCMCKGAGSGHLVLKIDGVFVDSDVLFKRYTFVDGSPCGKEVVV